MAQVNIQIDTDNSIFNLYDDEDNVVYAPELEVARILREIADNIEHGSIESMNIIDSNGNHVGRIEHETD